MVCHEAKSVDTVTKPNAAFLQQDVETEIIFVHKEYRLPTITTKNDVVESAVDVYAWFACHRKIIQQAVNLSTWKPDPASYLTPHLTVEKFNNVPVAT
jgi:hypothetical protein